jgi:hypothetical protein
MGKQGQNRHDGLDAIDKIGKLIFCIISLFTVKIDKID